MRGRVEKARRGLVSAYPFGYRPVIESGKPTGRMVVHGEKAATVRMIFDWHVAEQRSIRSITVELRRLGLRPQRGGAWRPSMVRRVLTNRAYIGQASFLDIAIPVPAIIAVGIFECAQEQLARNRALLAGRPSVVPFLLRGLLRCGSCRRTWYADSSRATRAYRCRGADVITRANCRANGISAVRLDQTVWDAVVGVLRNPAALRMKLARAGAALDASTTEVESEAQHVRRQLDEVGRQDRLLDLFLDETMRTDVVRGRLEALGRRRIALRERLARVEALVAGRAAAEAQHAAIERRCAQVLRGIDRLTPGSDVELHGVLPRKLITTAA